MQPAPAVETARAYLRHLCQEIPARCVGSPGNRAATAFVADRMTAFGFATETPTFDCMDWHGAGADLAVAGQTFEAEVSPYTLGCQVSAPLVVAATRQELESVAVADRVLLLRGDLTREPLMPKNFPFYNPEEHQQLIGLLEQKKPLAIIAATGRHPEMAGAAYPFPLFEDGDFDIPSVVVTENQGDPLAMLAGGTARLEIRAERRPSTGCNVIARRGDRSQKRVVLMAHIDAKSGTPGAIDNAAGVIVLLLLAELLAEDAGRLHVEIVAMNGEDYYSSPGEQQYLSLNAGRFGDIRLGINLDGLGYHQGRTAFSLYGAPDALAEPIRRAFSAPDRFVEGDPWYQGDHGLFLMREVPALAITSEHLMELVTHITHTPRDTPDIIAPQRLVETAVALRDLLGQLEMLDR